MTCQRLLFGFKCAFFVFLSVILLWSPSFLVSLPSSQKRVGKLMDTQDDFVLYLNHLFRPVLALNKLSERNWVFSEIGILLSIQFYATDSAYCKSLSWQDVQTVLGGWRKKRSRGGSWKQHVCSSKVRTIACWWLMRHSNQISFPSDLDTTLQSISNFPE